MEKKYVFLVGAPRSGTTWLQLMLSQHPDVATCQETHLFSAYFGALQRKWHQHEKDNRKVGLQAAISYEEFISILRQSVLKVLDAIGDKPVVLEKTPSHVQYVPEILDVLPEAYFLHIIRDPRSVAASLAAAGSSWGKTWASTDPEHNAKRWCEDVKRGLVIGKLTTRYKELHYETLLEKTTDELASIFEWLELDADCVLCQSIAENSQIRKLQNSKALGTPWDISKEPEGFYRKGEAEGWRSDLSSGDVAIVEASVGPLMRQLGYEMISSGPNPIRMTVRKARARVAWFLKGIGSRLSYD